MKASLPNLQLPSSLRPLVFTGSLWAVLCASLPAQESARIPGAIPHVDPELKSEVWVAPFKDGLAPVDNSALSLEERTALDDSLNNQRTAHGRTAERASAGDLDPAQMQSAVDSMRFHQLDRSSDGTLWAFGGTYKARFGADGASYIPFLGSDAPQNYPVTFRTLSAALGSQALAADLRALPEFDGDTAVYDRGAFEERYETRIGEVEQLFVFDELPGSGELVVRMAVDSELVGTGTAGGLEWSNALGAVTYSSAVAIDATGRRVAAATMLDGNIVELRVPEAFVANAVLPLTIDPVLATYSISLSPSHEYNPDIAYDMSFGVFMIVWEREWSAVDHDIWSEMFDVFGAPIAGSGSYIDFTSLSWSQPKCANLRAEARFLTVAKRTFNGQSDIWGVTRFANASGQGAQFQISTGSGQKDNPDVGGDPSSFSPSYYCVVWERVFNVGIDHDVHAQLVDGFSGLNGTLILVDNSGSSYDKYPTVSKSNGVDPFTTQEWNICWQRQYSPNDWDIRGAQVHWDGTQTVTSFSLDFSPRNDNWPQPSSPLDPIVGPRTYLVTYSRYDAPSWDTYATALRGATVISRANLTDIWNPTSTQDEQFASVDTNGKHFSIAFHRRSATNGADWDVFVAGVYLSGYWLRVSEGPLALSGSSAFEGFTQICARHSGGADSDYCGIVWYEATTSTNFNIEGATYDMPNDFGQIGSNYGMANPNSTGFPGSILVTGSTLVNRNDVTLQASRLPQNSTLFFITSMASGMIPNPGGSAGVLLLGGSIGRYVGSGQIVNTGVAGTADLIINLSMHPTPTGLVQVMSGQTWNFQAWHRDTAPNGASTSNFTDAASVTFF